MRSIVTETVSGSGARRIAPTATAASLSGVVVASGGGGALAVIAMGRASG